MKRVRVDTKAVRDEFLRPCGLHDYGVDSAGCACPGSDYRPVMLDLVEEVESLRSALPRRLTMGRLSIYLEPRDAWIGVYVAANAVYVCPVPFVVVRWRR